MLTSREHEALLNRAVGDLSANPYFDRLKEVVVGLVSLHRELALLLVKEKEDRTEAWQHAQDGTISGRDRIAEIATLTTSTEILRIKGEIAAFIEERDFLRLLIESTRQR